MKRMIMVMFSALALMVISPAMAHADRPGGFGIGLGTGTAVSGISGKVHSGDLAFQGVVGCWGYNCYGFGLSADILFNMPTIHDAGVVKFAWNLGGGAAMGVGERGWARRYYDRRYDYRTNFVLHAQFVAGLELIFPDVPLDIVFELRPAIRIVPPARPYLFSGGAHIRFYIQ